MTTTGPAAATPGFRTLGVRRLAAIVAVGTSALVAAATARAQPASAPPPEARLEALRDLAGTDPARARAELGALRDTARRAGWIDLRLAVDELECRLMIDIDIAAAARVADEGLAAGTAQGQSRRLPWLRLRTCQASALASQGRATESERALAEVLEVAVTDALAPARALALMERGEWRSSHNDMVGGQQDLIAACESMKAQRLEHDLVLCLTELANHHKRIGDLDEALSILQSLRDQARARGARFDESIYAYGLADVHQLRKAHPQALAGFQDAAALSRALDDATGLAYAENGTAAALLAMGRPQEALAQVDAALGRIEESADPGFTVRARILKAQVLTMLGRAPEADAMLRAAEPRARAKNEDWTMGQWLSARADTYAALGRWAEAYRALSEWRAIDTRQQQQRLSEATTRLRLQYSREHDRAELQTLRQLNEQGEELRRTQRLLLALVGLMLAASVGFAAMKLRQSRTLKSLAATDELTGLPNRRAIMAEAEQRMRPVAGDIGSLCLLMIDIDHFKRINDTFGHAVGDRVLRHVGRVLPTVLRSHDRLGRIGGEEFLVVLPEATLDQAMAVAHRMREALATAPLEASLSGLQPTVSIGIAEWRRGAEPLDALMARADAALYAAKSLGRDAVSVDGEADMPTGEPVTAP